MWRAVILYCVQVKTTSPKVPEARLELAISSRIDAWMSAQSAYYVRVWISEGLTQADSYFHGVGILISSRLDGESRGKFCLKDSS